MQDIFDRLIQIGAFLIAFGVFGYVFPFSSFLDVIDPWLIAIGAWILGIALLVHFKRGKRSSSTSAGERATQKGDDL